MLNLPHAWNIMNGMSRKTHARNETALADSTPLRAVHCIHSRSALACVCFCATPMKCVHDSASDESDCQQLQSSRSLRRSSFRQCTLSRYRYRDGATAMQCATRMHLTPWPRSGVIAAASPDQIMKMNPTSVVQSFAGTTRMALWISSPPLHSYLWKSAATVQRGSQGLPGGVPGSSPRRAPACASPERQSPQRAVPCR